MLKILTCCFMLIATPAFSAEGVSAVVFSDDGQFTIDAPAGWAIDNTAGAHQGVDVVLYPKGSSWAKAPAVMYARSISKIDNSAQKAIADDILNFTETLPGLVITDEPGMFTQDNKIIFIKRLVATTGSVELLAYIPEKSTVSILALDTKTRLAAEKSLPSFKKLVASYRAESGKTEAKPAAKPVAKATAPEQPAYNYVPAKNRANAMEYRTSTSDKN